MNIAKLKNKAEGLVTQMAAKDECEKRVLDAISNNKYAAPRSLLNEVAEDTFSHDSYSSVMRLVWKTIDSPPRNWRSIAKALILLDHLVKNGAEKVVANVQDHIHDITYLNEFRYMEGHLDRGSGVREKAQDLANLMSNPDRIQAERRKAKDLRAQYSGYGGDVPPRLSAGGGGGGSSRNFSSSSRDPHANRGSAGGGIQARDSGEISDDWTAGYDRSPTPPPIEARRVIGRSSGGRSQSIDFDEGREGYSGRLSRYQEQEKREASLASRPRRGSRDSAEGKGGSEPRTGSGSNKGASSSRKRTDAKRPSGQEPNTPAGHDLLSGDDPFPVVVPPRPQNDFSSFASFAAPQMLQGGAPVASGGWIGGGGMPQQQQQQQWAAPPPAQAGQLVPYGQGAPGLHVPQQQQPMQVQNGMQPQAQIGWGQQTLQGQQGGYGQAQGGQYAGQQGMQFPSQQQQFGQPHHHQQQHGQPQQQQIQPQQQHMQPQPQQMYQQYQQQQPVQPQQGYQQPPQQPHQQQQHAFQQQQTFQQSYQQEQPSVDQQQPFQPQPPQQQQGQLQPPLQHIPQPAPAQQLQQPQAPHSQAQQLQPPAAPLHAQQPPADAQQANQPAPQAQQQQLAGSGSSQPPGSDTSANTAAAQNDWVATEVVRAGIGGIDLAAAVGGLRQTGFKPSDVGGKTEFSGQGQRGSDGRHVGAPPHAQQRTAYPPPPQPIVEYVEGDQEGQEVVVQASTQEFLGARSGLKNTGLSTRLQETPQQQTPNPTAPASAGPSFSYQGVTQASGGGVTGAGQWQGLPQPQDHGRAGGGEGGGQIPSWQTRQGELRSTGLIGSGASAEQFGVSSQAQGPAASAPWQQGTAGLRQTGL